MPGGQDESHVGVLDRHGRERETRESGIADFSAGPNCCMVQWGQPGQFEDPFLFLPIEAEEGTADHVEYLQSLLWASTAHCTPESVVHGFVDKV